MGDLLGSLIWGAKKRTVLCHWGWIVTNGIRAIAQPDYQNSAVKRAAARAIPGWVTSWEVWYGEPKADSIVSLGVDRYKASE
jgi:hypothetical protein